MEIITVIIPAMCAGFSLCFVWLSYVEEHKRDNRFLNWFLFAMNLFLLYMNTNSYLSKYIIAEVLK